MANLVAMVMLVFFGTLIIAVSIPRQRNYHKDMAERNYQLSRIADSLEALLEDNKHKETKK